MKDETRQYSMGMKGVSAREAREWRKGPLFIVSGELHFPTTGANILLKKIGLIFFGYSISFEWNKFT